MPPTISPPPFPSQTPVLIIGCGPTGLLLSLALTLSLFSTPNPILLLERNLTTTHYPKMDLTNARSMELFRPNRLDISSSIRSIGVPPNYSLDVLFSTGLCEGGSVVAKWTLPSVSEKTELIRAKNDGSQAREAYQRGSQAVFEEYLQGVVQAEPLIDARWGWKFESLVEHPDHVTATVTEVATGTHHTIDAQYVIGCDGGGSRVRKAMGATMLGGPVPAALYLVHFRSRDLTRLRKQGQFWHIFFTSGQVLIAQDEVETWTLHTPVGLDEDVSAWDARDVVRRGLAGSMLGRDGRQGVEIEIEEVLVTSVWRPNIYVADRWRSDGGRVFVAGDAAHQMIPTGGYGMNTAVGDSFDLGWKVAAVLGGWGGEGLLRSYETERRPVAERCLERSGQHWKVQADVWGRCNAEGKRGVVVEASEEGRALRDWIGRHFEENDGENKDEGMELGIGIMGRGWW